MLPLKHHSVDPNSYSLLEERLNVASHFLGFLLALVGLFILSSKSVSISESVSTAVYGTSLAFMFLSSSIYHSASRKDWRLFLRKVDHTAIYLLIAGTYTPFLVLTVGGTWGWIGLGIIWAVGLSGILFKLTIGHKYPKIGVTTYAIMGWLSLFLIYPIYQGLSLAGFTLLLVGGICYSAGIPLYMMKKRHYSHALWHLAVVAGAACHFFAIYLHVL